MMKKETESRYDPHYLILDDCLYDLLLGLKIKMGVYLCGRHFKILLMI